MVRFATQAGGAHPLACNNLAHPHHLHCSEPDVPDGCPQAAWPLHGEIRRWACSLISRLLRVYDHPCCTHTLNLQMAALRHETLDFEGGTMGKPAGWGGLRAAEPAGSGRVVTPTTGAAGRERTCIMN